MRPQVPGQALVGWNWEYDLREPLVGMAAKIARALGVTLDELTGDGRAEEKAWRKKGGK
jgi:hypothetical protein